LDFYRNFKKSKEFFSCRPPGILSLSSC